MMKQMVAQMSAMQIAGCPQPLAARPSKEGIELRLVKHSRQDQGPKNLVKHSRQDQGPKNTRHATDPSTSGKDIKSLAN